jgi:hypothetical protein
MNKIETQVCTTIADYYHKILSSFLFFLLKSLINIKAICIRGPTMKAKASFSHITPLVFDKTLSCENKNLF